MEQGKTSEILNRIKTQNLSSGSNSPDWVLATNLGTNGETVIAIPQSGTLTIYYEMGIVTAPPLLMEILGPDGSKSVIQPGINTFQVTAEDNIVYQLANPSKDQIKLQYSLSS